MLKLRGHIVTRMICTQTITKYKQCCGVEPFLVSIGSGKYGSASTSVVEPEPPFLALARAVKKGAAPAAATALT